MQGGVLMSSLSPGLTHLLAQARTDPNALAFTLTAFQAQRGLSDESLANWLECSPQGLERLCLCQWPPPGEERVNEYSAQICRCIPCNGDRLREVLSPGVV